MKIPNSNKQKSTNQESNPSTILPETSLKIPMPHYLGGGDNVAGNKNVNNFQGANLGGGFAGRDYIGNVQHNKYHAPVGIGGVQGNIEIKDNAKVAGVINEYGSEKLADIAQEISKLLDYFENNPPINEAKQQVDTAIKNYPELNQPEIIEATIIENPNLKQRLFSASMATIVETVKIFLPFVGVAIEAVKAYQNP